MFFVFKKRFCSFIYTVICCPPITSAELCKCTVTCNSFSETPSPPHTHTQSTSYPPSCAPHWPSALAFSSKDKSSWRSACWDLIAKAHCTLPAPRLHLCALTFFFFILNWKELWRRRQLTWAKKIYLPTYPSVNMLYFNTRSFHWFNCGLEKLRRGVNCYITVLVTKVVLIPSLQAVQPFIQSIVCLPSRTSFNL